MREFKILITFGLIVASLWAIYPSWQWYRKSPEEREQLEREGSTLPAKALKLGLDLRGGMHLLLEVDKEKIPEGLSPSDALNTAIEILRNRVDQFGVAEPVIQRQGERWIVVELPGIKDPQRAKDLIGKTALLEFQIVDESEKIRDALKGEIPEGYELLDNKAGEPFLLGPTLLTGAALTEARVKIGGRFNQPYVALEFNPTGAKEFAKITGANVRRRLAIVLDDKVQSAPVIRERIPDGHAIIEGNFSMEEASDLAIVLRAGALPAPVKIIEERTIGPTLGSDTIRKSYISIIIGAILVVGFIVFYYRLSGLITMLALALDLLFILAGMSYFHATLTLPGIAGIILTIGMAVDANVLIFERIKEELKTGKTVLLAIDTGYTRVFPTILDANITTLIAAAFLFQFGTGPIKGFAVTLTLGVLASMFTACVVTHLAYDLALSGKRVEKLSI